MLPRALRRFCLFLASATVLGIAAPVGAHEGHDHGAPPPPVSVTIAPRADASSADFELVAIARSGKLRIYLDTFRENDPVRNAKIEVDGPEGTALAAETGDGAYEMAAPWLARPGSFDLAFTVEANGTVDVLTATLTIPEPSAPANAPGGLWQSIVGLAWAKDVRDRVATSDLTLLLVAAGSFLLGLVVAGLAGDATVLRPPPRRSSSRRRSIPLPAWPMARPPLLLCSPSAMSPSVSRTVRSSCRRPPSASWRCGRS